MKLVIVESPHKAETISGFLDADYVVVATKGHVKNLPKAEFGVIKTDGIYGGKWEMLEDKKKLLSDIKDLAKKATHIYIATDDDREGERIAWDVIEYIRAKLYYRIIFHEITKKAVLNAIKNGDTIDQNLVEAQMARRLIDRILGYPISEMLRDFFTKNSLATKEIIKNMGIGRVSAAALAILVENEEIIEKFVPQKYNKVRIDYFYDNIQFSVKSKVLFSEDQKEELDNFISLLKNTTETQHFVDNFVRKIQDVPPPPPLITSWLLRGISSQHGYMPNKTMRIAQELYEGVVIKGERVGLITYMRTDSYHVSDEAIFEIGQVVASAFGKDYLYENKRIYSRDKDSAAQEAHEAIRPTHFSEPYMPKNLKEFLTEEQFKVYSYIYYRTIALQMKSAVYNESSLVISIGGNKFQAYAHKQEFDGWEKIGKFWKNETDDNKEIVALPSELYAGQELKPLNIASYPYETQTPPRYGVGRFITTLEKFQIARPSTVAQISSHLESKGYIEIIDMMQKPTALGKYVYNFLKEYAPLLVNLAHAKEFEIKLDAIAKGELGQHELIAEYENLKDDMASRLRFVSRSERVPEGWMIEKANKLSTTCEELLTQEILSSYTLCHDYIRRHAVKLSKVGNCPSCKTGDVIEGEKNFYCKNHECRFVLWKSNIVKFFENFSKKITENDAVAYVQVILKKKKCFVFDLYSKKKQKTFPAYISIKHNQEYQNWGFSFDMPKAGEKVDPKYIVDHESLDREDYDNDASRIGGSTQVTETPNKFQEIKKPQEQQAIDATPTRTVFVSDAAKAILGANDSFAHNSSLSNEEFYQNNRMTDNDGNEIEDIPLSIKEVELSKEIETLKNEKRMLIDASKKDHLTRAYNKLTFDKDIVFKMSKKIDTQEYFLGFIDVDHFKNVNDTYGHQVGDEVLQGVVSSIFDEIRDIRDYDVYRYGGEEFAILGYDDSKTTIVNRLNVIRKKIEMRTFMHQNQTFTCTISIGVSFFQPNDKVKDFIHRADMLMYQAKKNGRNRIEFA